MISTEKMIYEFIRAQKDELVSADTIAEAFDLEVNEIALPLLVLQQEGSIEFVIKSLRAAKEDMYQPKMGFRVR